MGESVCGWLPLRLLCVRNGTETSPLTTRPSPATLPPAMTETGKMTKELHLKLVEAWWEGKLEIFDQFSGEWVFAHACVWASEDPSRYRIRPQPKLRPWRWDEVPVGAVIRKITTPSLQFLITMRWDNGLVYIDTSSIKTLSFQKAFDDCQHSLDGGKTWKPCGVEESQ